MPKIHPTAVVDPSAELAEDVEIGAFAVVEEDVKIGEGTVLRPHAVVRRYTTMGKGNFVDSFVVLGGDPQDYKFDPDRVSYLNIGDGNIFREGVTISRATTENGATTVENNTFWFANSHAGHDCHIHDNVILVNGTLLAGHCTIGKGAILPANGVIHQFCWVGEKAMFQGLAGSSMHVPPYVMCADVNKVMTLNKIGLRRSPDISDEERKQVRDAFDITYRSGLSTSSALEKMDQCTDWGDAPVKFREFIRRVVNAEPPFNRGLCPRISRLESRRRG